jgi:sec-independent protein translocase protein TatC
MGVRPGTEPEPTVLEHLHELWLRLVSTLLLMGAGAGLTYLYRQRVIDFLQRPLHEQLYYTSPMGSFQFVMQVCLLSGLVLSLPILIYHMLRYIEPALGARLSRRLLLTVICASLGLAACGVVFAYYLTLPATLRFFTTVGTTSLRPLISVNEYFSFIAGYLATFAVVFQLPLLLLFINRLRPFQPGGLTRRRQHVYVGAFAVSLIMPSSPDPLSQVSLAIPIIFLYELSAFLIWQTNRNIRRPAHSAAARRTNVRVPGKEQRTQQPALAVTAPALENTADVVSAARLEQPPMRKRGPGERMRPRSKVITDVYPPRRNYQVPQSRRDYASRQKQPQRNSHLIHDIMHKSLASNAQVSV